MQSIKTKKPCKSAKWDLMDSSTKGKYCTLCSKDVHDFTKLDRNQIVNLINEQKESVCGLLNTNQISKSRRRNLQSISKYAAILTLLFGSSDIKATSYVDDSKDFKNLFYSTKKIKAPHKTLIIQDSILIKGKLIEIETNTPIKALLKIEELKLSIESDTTGRFAIPIAKNFSKDSIELSITSSGHHKKTIRIPTRAHSETIIELEPELYLGEVIIVREKKWWQFWKWF